MSDELPHSRACGWQAHPHGVMCSSNCPTCHGRAANTTRWWRYAVLRGEGVRADLDGKWLDLTDDPDVLGSLLEVSSVTFHATNQWEQRDDGQVAVVYRSPERAAPNAPTPVYICGRCNLELDGNPRFCPRCGYTVYRPTWPGLKTT